VARSFAVDPRSLDGVFVRPKDLDAEAWSVHAGEWHQHDPESVRGPGAHVGTGLGMGSRFGSPQDGGDH
jgi:twitching motility protein PilT